MRTEISRSYRIEAAHRLPHVPADHKCHRLHGHSFQITVVVEGPVDSTMGWVIDFADIDRAFAPLFARLDHHYLNEIEGLENPTSEVLARYILERLELPTDARGKAAEVRVTAVTVSENCTARCTVHAD
ncbi:MAG: 6-carboxytetrahydropterin synthase QueD [Myxococcales bacterium]|nr:6-carboxytetrahydropterin synthase QueD [Myxococcales bacterium]